MIMTEPAHTCCPDNPPQLLDGTCEACVFDHATELVLDGEFKTMKAALTSIWKAIDDHA